MLGHHIEEKAVGFTRIVYRQDVRMRETRRQLDFAKKASAPISTGDLRSQDLDRDLSLVTEVVRQKNDPAISPAPVRARYRIVRRVRLSRR